MSELSSFESSLQKYANTLSKHTDSDSLIGAILLDAIFYAIKEFNDILIFTVPSNTFAPYSPKHFEYLFKELELTTPIFEGTSLGKTIVTPAKDIDNLAYWLGIHRSLEKSLTLLLKKHLTSLKDLIAEIASQDEENNLRKRLNYKKVIDNNVIPQFKAEISSTIKSIIHQNQFISLRNINSLIQNNYENRIITEMLKAINISEENFLRKCRLYAPRIKEDEIFTKNFTEENLINEMTNNFDSPSTIIRYIIDSKHLKSYINNISVIINQAANSIKLDNHTFIKELYILYELDCFCNIFHDFKHSKDILDMLYSQIYTFDEDLQVSDYEHDIYTDQIDSIMLNRYYIELANIQENFIQNLLQILSTKSLTTSFLTSLLHITAQNTEVNSFLQEKCVSKTIIYLNKLYTYYSSSDEGRICYIRDLKADFLYNEKFLFADDTKTPTELFPNSFYDRKLELQKITKVYLELKRDNYPCFTFDINDRNLYVDYNPFLSFNSICTCQCPIKDKLNKSCNETYDYKGRYHASNELTVIEKLISSPHFLCIKKYLEEKKENNFLYLPEMTAWEWRNIFKSLCNPRECRLPKEKLICLEKFCMHIRELKLKALAKPIILDLNDHKYN